MSRRRTPRTGSHAVAALVIVMSLLAVGCKTPRSTRTTPDDLLEMSEAMTQSLLASDAIRRRTPDSPPWVITIRKVQNLSNDVLTDAERWYVMAHLRSSLPINTMSRRKNINFVIPAERAELVRQFDDIQLDGAFAADRRPTHVLDAVFRSATRASAIDRTDYYYVEFELLPLDDPVPVWTDRFEYKRVGRGHIWD